MNTNFRLLSELFFLETNKHESIHKGDMKKCQTEYIWVLHHTWTLSNRGTLSQAN